MEVPPHLSPFVLPLDVRAADRVGGVDLYLPDAPAPSPAVVFVHGLVAADQQPAPRDWPVFQGYGSLAAGRGVVGVTFDHRLYGMADFESAADDLAAAVETARSHPRVDPDRVALWFFSGSGLLSGDWLRNPPPWLRCVATSYPVLAGPPGAIDDRFQPAGALAGAGELPIVLVRAGLERPMIAATVEAFVAAAQAGGARLEIVDVPNGQHAFDVLDHTDESRKAVEHAFDLVLSKLV